MNNMRISIVLLAAAIAIAGSGSGTCKDNGARQGRLRSYPAGLSCEESGSDRVERILKELNEAATQLKSYQSGIEHKVIQPLFETETLRKGVLYYQKSEKQSKLRVNLTSLKQDDEKEQEHLEQYVINGTGLKKLGYHLTGVWLAHIDYQVRQVKIHQLAEPDPAEPNKAVDVFELIGRTFPLIGFTKTDELRKQFEISLVEPHEAKATPSIHLRLKVKPDSVYKDDYTSIDFWIDKETHLPVRIVGTSTEQDIYKVELIRPGINKYMDERIFEIEIPEGFGKPQIMPLKSEGRSK